MIEDGSKYAFELQNLLRFLHLLDITDSLKNLDEVTKKSIIVFLTRKIEASPYYIQLEIAYFLMKLDNKEGSHVLVEVVERALSELQKQKYSDKFVKEFWPLTFELGRSFVQPTYQFLLEDWPDGSHSVYQPCGHEGSTNRAYVDGTNPR